MCSHRQAADGGELPPLGGVRCEEQRCGAQAGEAGGRSGAEAERYRLGQLRRLFFRILVLVVAVYFVTMLMLSVF